MKTKKYLKLKRQELVDEIRYLRKSMKEKESEIRLIDECLEDLK